MTSTAADRLVLLPAVDVADGQAVRLVQGAAGHARRRTASRWPLRWPGSGPGREWVHLVDLDAAFGRGENRELLAEVVGRLDVDVELSGGIRDDASLEAALATGCARVNIGTAALEDPRLVRVGDRPVRRPGRGRAGRAGHDAGRARAGPRRAASCSRCWPGWTATAAPATSSPTSAGTAP